MASVNDIDERPTRVALWTYPRTRSLTMEFAMATQKDTAVYHENFYAAYLFGDDDGDEEEGLPEFGYNEVQSNFERCDPDKSVVFAKEMAFTLQGNYNLLPNGFVHTFLIRNPEKSIASLYKVFSGTESRRPDERTVQMSGVDELYELYKHVEKVSGKQPIIIDSDDLVRFPSQILRKYCYAVGIKYSESMMTWNSGAEKVESWPEPLQDATFMYEDALKSTCFDFNLSSVGVVNQVKLPPIVKTSIESCRPLYREMWERRIRPDTKETEI
ncbi:uncharacterized protein [Ptychodera flava]|uniref:uncharacterized protein n=1 Tax=Ptychodera flava TaxID=63121 RepID=UPI00396AAC9D